MGNSAEEFWVNVDKSMLGFGPIPKGVVAFYKLIAFLQNYISFGSNFNVTINANEMTIEISLKLSHNSL